ncbi:MAG: SGNH/GDSL hydrolase family protein [Planctomycetaceae bacterium]|nr:SGNH/GDSL hydrolase family protein [Planctomycetaceae bacterium]
MLRLLRTTFVLGSCLLIGSQCWAAPPAEGKVVGDWEVLVTVPAHDGQAAITQKLAVPVPPVLEVVDEKHAALPVYNAQGPQYARGARLNALLAESLTAPDLLDPASVVVRTGPGETGELMERGKDYEFESRWGGLGRLPEGRIKEGQPCWISYHHTLQHLDSIVLTADGKIVYREGVAKSTVPRQPELNGGERRLINVWFTRTTDKLNDNQLFSIQETEYPEPAAASPSIAEQRIPKTMAKIRSGEKVRILAWGDSVTDAAYLSNRDQDRWQEQFVARLRKRFPNANIELVTEAWGGRNTGSYLGVPPGQPHNYQETVLDAKPDLIISEFVNDAGLNVDAVEARYSKLLADFEGIGAEWIILTPHYVRPDWMGLDRESDVDDDPRPYVKGLRLFSEKHNVALADAALRYGRLWRQGIPHNSIMINCINHPDPRGLKIFADALMQLFPEK